MVVAPVLRFSPTIDANESMPYSVPSDVDVVRVSLSSGAVTVTLPDAALSANEGREIEVKVVAGDPATNAITINSAGGTIDGLAQITPLAPDSGVLSASDGTNWLIL